jgi:RNA polymerase sigma factor (sigma-70 family)
MSLKTTVLNPHADLIEQCRQGDREAHYRLYKLYARSMYNVGYRIVNHAGEAEDVLQEAFISAFRNLEYYRGDASFGSWLKRIVVNKAINVIKKRRTEPLAEGADYSVDQVKRAIASLPDGYRSVLSLYLLEGYDHSEIAEILGISESTSKSQFNRSKKKLLSLLEEGKL